MSLVNRRSVDLEEIDNSEQSATLPHEDQTNDADYDAPMPYTGKAQRQDRRESTSQSSAPKPEQGTPEDESRTDDAEPSGEERTWKKRYGDLRRHMQKTTDGLKEEIANLKQQLENTVTGDARLPKSKEEVKEWVQKYPDVAAIVEAIAAEQADKQTQKLSKDFEALTKAQQELAREKALVAIRKAHPDFDTLVETDEFHAWASDQDEEIQAWIYDNPDKSNLVVRAIDLYKADTNKTRKPKQNNTDAARTVTNNGRADAPESGPARKWKESDVKKLTPAQFERYEADIEKAVKSGNFIYDLSSR